MRLAINASFIKACACDAPRSTCGAIRMETHFDPNTKSQKVRAVHYPGPSCDACGKPWCLEQSAARP